MCQLSQRVSPSLRAKGQKGAVPKRDAQYLDRKEVAGGSIGIGGGVGGPEKGAVSKLAQRLLRANSRWFRALLQMPQIQSRHKPSVVEIATVCAPVAGVVTRSAGQRAICSFHCRRLFNHSAPGLHTSVPLNFLSMCMALHSKPGPQVLSSIFAIGSTARINTP